MKGEGSVPPPPDVLAFHRKQEQGQMPIGTSLCWRGGTCVCLPPVTSDAGGREGGYKTDGQRGVFVLPLGETVVDFLR